MNEQFISLQIGILALIGLIVLITPVWEYIKRYNDLYEKLGDKIKEKGAYLGD